MDEKSQDNQVIVGRNAVLAFLQEQSKIQADVHASAKDQKAANHAHVGGVKVNKIVIAQGLRPDARLEQIKKLAKLHNIPISLVERRVLDRFAGVDQSVPHQGVLAQVSTVELLELTSFLQHLTKQNTDGDQAKSWLIVVLDGIEDPHNLGAIIRVAECAGAQAVLLPARRSASITASVAKTSAGAVASLPVVRIGNIVNALEELKQFGFWIAGLEPEASQNYLEADLAGPIAVVIGSEGRGLGRLVAKHCDFLLRIPMFGKTNSLNASVAAGIVFFEIIRQRLVKKEEVQRAKQKTSPILE
jgi:23S rRNA (guanosine2251-2'-O)-methyltransferase